MNSLYITMNALPDGYLGFFFLGLKIFETWFFFCKNVFKIHRFSNFQKTGRYDMLYSNFTHISKARIASDTFDVSESNIPSELRAGKGRAQSLKQGT